MRAKFIGPRSAVLEPGEYIIGDPCYVIPDDSWAPFLSAAKSFDGESEGLESDDMIGDFTTHDGRTAQALAFATMYGDGTYTDEHGRAYGVDAGLIGIVLASDVGPKEVGEIAGHGLSHRVTFTAPFTCSIGHDGKLFFGDVTIDTGETSGDEEG